MNDHMELFKNILNYLFLLLGHECLKVIDCPLYSCYSTCQLSIALTFYTHYSTKLVE
jgi:hypothetical protein